MLEDISGNILSSDNKKIYINAGGIKDGLRNKRDGFTFFGYTKENSKGEVINDFILNLNKQNSEKISGENACKNKSNRLFVIFYDRLSQKYFIRNFNESMMKEKSLIYIKVDSSYNIESKKFFLMGQMLVNIDPDYKG